jgi:hypothetical protein
VFKELGFSIRTPSQVFPVMLPGTEIEFTRSTLFVFTKEPELGTLRYTGILEVQSKLFVIFSWVSQGQVSRWSTKAEIWLLGIK